MTMTATLADKLAPYGIDYVDAMERFDDAYNQAHSLKGVAGNLSLRTLYEAATYESDALHAGEYEAAEKHLPQVEEAHKKAVEGLEALRDGTL